MKEIVLEIAAFAYCLHPGEPMNGMYHPGGGDLVLTEGGIIVTRRLHQMASAALDGPAGMGPHRPLLFLARQAFGSGDGEACASVASLLGDVAEELLHPAPYEPEEPDFEAVA